MANPEPLLARLGELVESVRCGIEFSVSPLACRTTARYRGHRLATGKRRDPEESWDVFGNARYGEMAKPQIWRQLDD
jgi:hypothetical protein